MANDDSKKTIGQIPVARVPAWTVQRPEAREAIPLPGTRSPPAGEAELVAEAASDAPHPADVAATRPEVEQGAHAAERPAPPRMPAPPPVIAPAAPPILHPVEAPPPPPPVVLPMPGRPNAAAPVVAEMPAPPPIPPPPARMGAAPAGWKGEAPGVRVPAMTLRKIATIGHPVLRQQARPVTREELETPAMQAFIDDLIETMRDANGAGLAANQIHEPVQICAIEVGDNPRYPYKPKIPLTILVNPEIELLGDETFDNYEGCLSVPDLRGVVPRHVRIRLRAWDRHGQPIDQVIEGLSAGTFQHECDHLQGKLFLDRVRDTKTLCTWKEFERHHRAAFVERVQALVARFGS